MQSMYYIGLDIHKKIIAFCIKTENGGLVSRGKIKATRESLTEWIESLPHPWTVAMEATLFTGWVYDFLKPFAHSTKVAHPEMLKAITAAKKKNDRSDAERICDLLRIDMLPECYMAPSEVRELRRIMRYRNHIMRAAVKEKNKISGLLMEVGATYNKKRLHGKKYFSRLLETVEHVPESVHNMIKISRSNLEMFTNIQERLVAAIKQDKTIKERVQGLLSIPGVGEVTALTWVLEIGEPERFGSIAQAISYCGLCAAQKESAGKEYRGPLSKKRNKHLQTVLIEAAKLAPLWNRQLSQVHQKALAKGNRNKATLAVARKLVAYMLAVDKSKCKFQPRGKAMAA